MPGLTDALSIAMQTVAVCVGCVLLVFVWLQMAVNRGFCNRGAWNSPARGQGMPLLKTGCPACQAVLSGYLAALPMLTMLPRFLPLLFVFLFWDLGPPDNA